MVSICDKIDPSKPLLTLFSQSKEDYENLKSRIEDQGYVGLKEYKINMYEGEGKIFNPETTGNNYSWPFI